MATLSNCIQLFIKLITLMLLISFGIPPFRPLCHKFTMYKERCLYSHWAIRLSSGLRTRFTIGRSVFPILALPKVLSKILSHYNDIWMSYLTFCYFVLKPRWPPYYKKKLRLSQKILKFIYTPKRKSWRTSYFKPVCRMSQTIIDI